MQVPQRRLALIAILPDTNHCFLHAFTTKSIFREDMKASSRPRVGFQDGQTPIRLSTNIHNIDFTRTSIQHIKAAAIHRRKSSSLFRYLNYTNDNLFASVSLVPSSRQESKALRQEEKNNTGYRFHLESARLKYSYKERSFPRKRVNHFFTCLC